MPRKCSEENCTHRANFNFPGEKEGKYCKKDMKIGMIDVKNKKCENCGIVRASFNFPGNKHGKFCTAHKEKGMVDISKTSCLLCGKIASFNFKGSKPKFCCEHKEENMIDVVHKVCEYKDCSTRPSYNFFGLSPKYCRAHKEEEMEDVSNKKCEYKGCKKQPGYGHQGQTKRFCNEHKEKDMIDLVNKKCLLCDKLALYNLQGFPAEYCKTHKNNNMIDVCNKKCIVLDCNKYPTYNFKGKKGDYCGDHRKDGMINVNTKLCQFLNCSTTAGYGNLFSEKTHCAKHKTHNMFMQNKPKCESCPNDAYYTNDKTNYPKRCEDHQEENDRNIIEKPCKSCHLPFFLNAESEMCNDCNEFFIVKSTNKVKETEVVTFLKNKGLTFETTDKIIVGGCSKYRPDIVLDAIHAKIIIEIDENQHKSYSSECEKSRMMQIHQDFGGIPIIFIRYNPDGYKQFNSEGEISGKTIRANKKRLDVLYDVVNSISNTTKKEYNIPLSVCYLFYDGYNGKALLNEIKYEFN